MVDGATGVIERQVIEIEVFSPLGQSVMRLRGASLFNVADLASGTLYGEDTHPTRHHPAQTVDKVVNEFVNL